MVAGRGLSLRSKLALMFVSVCMVTFGIGGYLVSSSAKTALEREILGRLEYQSKACATGLDAYLQMLARRSEDFASDGFIRDRLEALIGGSEDAPRLREELRTHLVQNKLPLEPAFLDLALVGDDGVPLLAARGEGAAAPMVEGARFRGDPGGTLCSDLIPPDGMTAHPRLAISTPVTSRGGGRRLGSLVASVHPAVWIVGALRPESGPGDGDSGQVTLQLIDRSGRVMSVLPELTDPAGPRVTSDLVRTGFGLALVDDAAQAHAAEHDAFSRSYPIAASGWSVRVELGGEDLYAEVAGLQSRFVGLGVVLSLAAGLLFLFPMRLFTRPLLHLAQAARRLAGGDLGTRVVEDTEDELGELAVSFNRMAEAVEDRTHRLERTADDLRARQEELRFERDRLSAVISAMRDGLVVLDADGTPVIRNRAAGPLLKELRAEHSTLLPHHTCESADSRTKACHECLLSPGGGPRSCVVEIDGGVFEVHAAKMEADSNGRSGRVLVSRNLTDRIEQDEKQIHQERLAVLGEVAAVMAHELNNPLAAISMYNQMLAAELRDEPALRENVDVIQRNVESCTSTIRELLDYATAATPELGAVDLRATLEDVSTFLRPLRERKNVELSLNLPDSELLVNGDEIQLRQVFVNLIVNAIQACGPDGGSVSVTSKVGPGHCVVDVLDDGGGIPDDVREKIFRPFFTTKARGQGTGLGLPTARRITEMHGGRLDLVESGPDGTCFRVRLQIEREEEH